MRTRAADSFQSRLHDIVAHLHDPAYLETNPLGELRGRALHRAIVEGIEALRPGRRAAPDTRASRLHELMRMRYLDGLSVDHVRQRLAIGRSEYYRLHDRALEAVAALLGGVSAPAPSSASGAGHGHNLPAQVTNLIAREDEVNVLRDLLETARILTLTGTGGAGKTRLAIEVARQTLERYRDGAWFVDLAPLSDAALVPQAVATAVGVRERPGRTISDALLEYVAERRLLIVLDNCEHLADASARLALAMAAASPESRILATSREPLGITGEITWRVPSLPLPELDEPDLRVEALARVGAVRLFVERAAAARPGFHMTEQNARTVAEICRRLDGLPLALELAAARVRALPVEEIAARLDQRFRLLTGGSRAALPRQQTLAALVGWSYDLLTEPEKRLFARLSVFSGSFSLEAAEEVCSGDQIDDDPVLDLLPRLVDRSLVQAETASEGQSAPVTGGARYRLLETLRQYGSERLLEWGEADAIAHRHALYFLGLAESGITEWNDPNRVRPLEPDADNLRAALAHFRDDRDVEAALRLTSALGAFWYMSGRIAEGRDWIATLLRMPEAAAVSTATRCDALRHAYQQARNRGERDLAHALADESASLARHLGDSRRLMLLLRGLARDESDAGRADEAEQVVAQMASTIDRFPELRVEFSGSVASTRSKIALVRGDLDAAEAWLAEMLACAKRRGTEHIAAGHAAEWRGNIALLRGDVAAAITFFETSLATFRAGHDRPGEAHGLLGLGLAALSAGDLEEARRRLDAALSLEHELGDHLWMPFALEGLAGVAAGSAAEDASASRTAFVLAGAAAAMRESTGGALWPMFRELVEHWLAPAREALGTEAELDAMAEGRAMSVDQIVALAAGPVVAPALERRAGPTRA